MLPLLIGLGVFVGVGLIVTLVEDDGLPGLAIGFGAGFLAFFVALIVTEGSNDNRPDYQQQCKDKGGTVRLDDYNRYDGCLILPSGTKSP